MDALGFMPILATLVPQRFVSRNHNMCCPRTLAVCVLASTYAYLHIYLRMCIYLHTYVCVYMHTHMHIPT
jgi:hypothetical protein